MLLGVQRQKRAGGNCTFPHGVRVHEERVAADRRDLPCDEHGAERWSLRPRYIRVPRGRRVRPLLRRLELQYCRLGICLRSKTPTFRRFSRWTRRGHGGVGGIVYSTSAAVAVCPALRSASDSSVCSPYASPSSPNFSAKAASCSVVTWPWSRKKTTRLSISACSIAATCAALTSARSTPCRTDPIDGLRCSNWIEATPLRSVPVSALASSLSRAETELRVFLSKTCRGNGAQTSEV